MFKPSEQSMLRRLIYVLAVAIITHVLLAQAPPNPPNHPETAQKPPGNCTVKGRVVSATDGTPLQSARVGLIQRDDRKRPKMYGATTDSEGHFEISQIEAGRYLFFASHVGYLEQGYKAQGSGIGKGAILSLISGQEVPDVLFRLVRAAVITGRVVDDAGEPMTGVNVSVLRNLTEDEKEDRSQDAKKRELQSVSSGATDDRGEYRIFGLDPGEYYIKASETGEPQGPSFTFGASLWVARETGSLYAPVYYPGVLQMAQAQTVFLRAGEEMQADFSMRRIKTVEVSGRVIAIDGSPANRAYVNLMPDDLSGNGEQMFKNTDDKGEFSFKGVSPGSYVLWVEEHDSGLRYHARRKIEVGEEKVDSIVLALGGGATIHGRIVTSGASALALNRVRVFLSPASDTDTAGSMGGGEVKKDGSFELNGLGDGSYALQAYAGEPDWYVKSAHLGNEDVLEKGIHVENGAAAGNLEIVISSDGAQLEGTVTDNDQNQPLAGVQVRIRPDPATEYNRFPWHQASTDQNGHYVIKDVPPGKYKVVAKIPAPGGGAPSSKSDPVAVTLGDREHRTVDIKLEVPRSE
jgi:protocatechuate 3,4-dioxygenase beta subunit